MSLSDEIQDMSRDDKGYIGFYGVPTEDIKNSVKELVNLIEEEDFSDKKIHISSIKRIVFNHIKSVFGDKLWSFEQIK